MDEQDTDELFNAWWDKLEKDFKTKWAKEHGHKSKFLKWLLDPDPNRPSEELRKMTAKLFFKIGVTEALKEQVTKNDELIKSLRR